MPRAKHRPEPSAVERAAVERDRRITHAQRRERGVVHTPAEVARFIVRRVDHGLRTLGVRGFGDPRVMVADPACGPGVFLAAALERVGEGAWGSAIGLDVDPDAIRDAERVLRPLAAGRALHLEVANTLERPLPDDLRHGTLALIGNPPWAARSANAGARYTDALLPDFRVLPDGSPLEERKIGVLSDDYVRFFRWAAEQIRRASGGGVLGFVTNASFVDGPVHRAMRGALASWFSHVEVYDLGGSALIARRGDRDENVFGVRPAAAITIAVRPPGHEERPGGRVLYACLRGSRADKLSRLSGASVAATVELEAVMCAPPRYSFAATTPVPPEYETWPSLAELMPFHREGLQTNRDAMCVDHDPEVLRSRLRRFADGASDVPGRAGLPSAHYDPERARHETRAALARGDAIRPVAYRPLDRRWVAVVPKLCHRPRAALLNAMGHSELALLTVRKDRGERPWTHFGATRDAVDNCFLSTRSSCRTRAFPTHGPDGRPNVDAARLAELTAALEIPLEGGPGAEELVFYALGVLACPRYRRRYDAALRVDYPRIPAPESSARWHATVAAGRDVAAAFRGDAAGAEETWVGHHAVRSTALVAAIARSEAATEGLFVRAHELD